MIKASKFSAAELLFAPRFANRGRPQSVQHTVPAAPKTFLARAQRPTGTMHLPRKS
jgi:hypothetical protein